MDLSAAAAKHGNNRRWAGSFRVCGACGARNWVGARRCRGCSALLVTVCAVPRPPVAMVGRRSADRVLTPRIRAAAAVAAALALAAGAALVHVLRADGFEVSRTMATDVPAPAPGPEAASVPAERAAMPERWDALRAAERGRRLLAAGQVKDALGVLGPASHALPDSAELAHLHAEALWRFGSRDRAVFQYQRALRLSPATEAYREDLARALRSVGRVAEAARVLYGPNAPAVLAEAGTAPPVSLEGGVDLGGAGSGGYAGRRSFTDQDLRTRVHAAPGRAPR